MGISKLKLPKVCGHCEKPLEAKTMTTRFCSDACNTATRVRRKTQTVDFAGKCGYLLCHFQSRIKTGFCGGYLTIDLSAKQKIYKNRI